MLLSINPERVLTQADRNLGTQASLLDSIVRESIILHDAILECVASRVSEGIDIVGVGHDGGGTGGSDFGHVRSLRRTNRHDARGLRRLSHAVPPRLLDVRRRLLDLWLPEQAMHGHEPTSAAP